MNIIANTGIQLFTFPIEINLNDNFKMYFHEWFDTADAQLKLEISHFFSEEEVWVKKQNLSLLGYAPGGIVTDIWESIREDFKENGYFPIPIETDLPQDSGCFQLSINSIKWDKFENTWFPMPFFQLNGNKSEFGPTNWCRFKLIPVQNEGKVKKYNLLIVFDTKSVFEKPTFQDEALNETPVFSNTFEKSKDFALCNNEYKLLSYFSEELNCDWVDKYLFKQFHNLENFEEYRGPKPKLNYLAQFIYLIRYIQQSNFLPKITLFSNQNVNSVLNKS
jgi:hypothetical protein